MKVVIAPDKFKGCLPARDVAAAIAEGVRRAAPHATLDLCPVADGGEGTVDALVAATAGRTQSLPVIGPLPGTTVHAAYGILGDQTTYVIEMAAAAGLALLPPDRHDPLATTTFGVGQLIRHAASAGAKRIILGIGGSATNDGGVGCAQGAGARVWIETNPRSRSRFNIEEALPIQLDEPFVGRDLAVFHSILKPDLPAGLEILVACDVTNPLYGPTGAAHVYAPQKGASPEAVEELDRGLERLAIRTRKMDLAKTPGAGAAGGLGFGLAAFFAATLLPGTQIVFGALRLRDRLAGADLCITGEGRLDAQSLSGKTPVGVARLCTESAVPCIAIAGTLDVPKTDLRHAGIHQAYEIATPEVPLDERIRRAKELLTTTAEQAVRNITK